MNPAVSTLTRYLASDIYGGFVNMIKTGAVACSLLRQTKKTKLLSLLCATSGMCTNFFPKVICTKTDVYMAKCNVFKGVFRWGVKQI